MNKIINHLRINWKNYLIVFLAIIILVGPISQTMGNSGFISQAVMYDSYNSHDSYDVRSSALAKGGSGVMLESASVDNFNGERKKTKNANGRIETENYDKSKRDLQSILDKYSSIVLSENENKDNKDYRTLYMNAKVDASKFDSFLKEVKNLGEVEYLNINSNDVTQSYESYDERVKRYEKQLQTYKDKLDNKNLEVKDEIEIQTRIDQLEDNIYYLKKSFENVENRVEYSQLSLNLVEKYSISDEVNFTSCEDMWKNFLVALNNGIGTFINILGFIIPFIIIYLVYRFAIKPFYKK